MTGTGEENKDLPELLSIHDLMRREIMHNETITIQILGATLLTVSAIMGFAFSTAIQDVSVKSFLFFVAWGIALIAMSQNLYKTASIFLIASYLRVFIEPRLSHARWETRLSEFRLMDSVRRPTIVKPSPLWIYVIIIIANQALYSWYAIQIPKEKSYLFFLALLILGLLVAVSSLIIQYTLGRNSEFDCKDKSYDIWDAIKKNELLRSIGRVPLTGVNPDDL